MKDSQTREWIERVKHDTGRVVRRETNYMTKDEWQEEQRRKWREDDEIRRSRKCKLS